MISGISQGSKGADIMRSIDTISAVLQNGQDAKMQLAEKLMKVGVQQTIQDTKMGTIIDAMA
jgi:hypothetical protein